MSKYEPLRYELERQSADRVVMTFDDVGALVGGLPPSAFEHREWWANTASHSHARSWHDAGFRVDAVDFNRFEVTFARVVDHRSQKPLGDEARADVPASACDRVRELLERLSGGDPVLTLTQGRPNWVVRTDNDRVWVHTAKTKGAGTPEPVPIAWLLDSCELLVAQGSLDRSDLRKSQAGFRSAFILSILAQLPEVRHTTTPKTVLYLS